MLWRFGIHRSGQRVLTNSDTVKPSGIDRDPRSLFMKRLPLVLVVSAFVFSASWYGAAADAQDSGTSATVAAVQTTVSDLQATITSLETTVAVLQPGQTPEPKATKSSKRCKGVPGDAQDYVATRLVNAQAQ